MGPRCLATTHRKRTFRGLTWRWIHQRLVAQAALALPEARTLALAGGGAMIAHGYTDRNTRDIDLFTEIDDDEAIQVAAALRAALQERGLHLRQATEPHDHRFIVVDPGNGSECLVEVFADGGRLRPRVRLDLGDVLRPDDLAADKILALWARPRPRDYHDVAALLERFGPEHLLELAAKDAGFSPATFIDALRAIHRLSDADWSEEGVPSHSPAELRALYDRWRSALENPARADDPGRGQAEASEVDRSAPPA